MSYLPSIRVFNIWSMSFTSCCPSESKCTIYLAPFSIAISIAVCNAAPCPLFIICLVTITSVFFFTTSYPLSLLPSSTTTILLYPLSFKDLITLRIILASL